MVLIDGHTRSGNSPLQAMCLSRKGGGHESHSLTLSMLFDVYSIIFLLQVRAGPRHNRQGFSGRMHTPNLPCSYPHHLQATCSDGKYAVPGAQEHSISVLSQLLFALLAFICHMRAVQPHKHRPGTEPAATWMDLHCPSAKKTTCLLLSFIMWK